MTGMFLIFLGMFLILASSLLNILTNIENIKIGGGAIIMIGPIPILIGAGIPFEILIFLIAFMIILMLLNFFFIIKLRKESKELLES